MSESRVRVKGQREANAPEANESVRGCCPSLRGCLRRNLFVLLLIMGICLGVALGFLLRYLKPHWTPRELFYYKFPGELLLRALQLMVLPLVVTSIISGMSLLGGKTSSKMGMSAVVYYLSTTLIAVVIGILMVISIRPGEYGKSKEKPDGERTSDVNAADSALDLIRNLVPDNLIDACLHRVQTIYKLNPLTNVTESDNSTVPELINVDGTNLLGVLVFSVAFGIALGQLDQSGQQARDFFEGSSKAVLLVVHAISWFTPIGIIFLISGKIIEMKNLVSSISQLGFYTLTVVVALVIHGFIVLPLAYLIFVRRNPFVYMYGCLRALLTALSTASSSATLPITLYCIEEVNGVNKQISRFVIPIGATINMDGTALYEAVAAIFIAQLNGISLNFVQIITVCLTATLAAVGAAGIPEAGLVTMMIVLTAVGLPSNDLGLILSIDWLLDRFRTAINVWGDCIGAGIVESLSGINSEPTASASIDDVRNRDEGDHCQSGLEYFTSSGSSTNDYV